MDAEQLLRRLGVTGNLKGFYSAVYMIERIRYEPTAGMRITRNLYPETARHFQTTPGAVERNMRFLIRVCWNRPDHDFLEEMAGTRLYEYPKTREFLDMAAAYLRRQQQD